MRDRTPSGARRRLARRMFASDGNRREWLEQTLLRAGEVAVLMQVSRRSVAAWARAGRLPFIETPGGHRRFRASDVRRLIESLDVATPEWFEQRCANHSGVAVKQNVEP